MKVPAWFSISFVLALMVSLSACSVVSKNVREQAADLPFSALTQNPQAYSGQTVILGGYVACVANLPKQSRVMVLHAPLDFQDRPKAREKSQGRFMVVTDDFLDPMVYEKGRRITVAGTVTGQTTEKVADYAYTMPEVRAGEYHLWEAWSSQPPYYRDPYYPPWWGSDAFFYYRWHLPYRRW